MKPALKLWLGFGAVAVLAIASRLVVGSSGADWLGVGVFVGVAALILWGWDRVIIRGGAKPSQPPPETSAFAAERLNLARNAAGTSMWDAYVPAGRVLLDERWSAMLGGEARETEMRWRELAYLLHPDDRHAAARLQSDAIFGRSDGYRADFRVRTQSG